MMMQLEGLLENENFLFWDPQTSTWQLNRSDDHNTQQPTEKWFSCWARRRRRRRSLWKEGGEI